jgi:hypothetical protein
MNICNKTEVEKPTKFIFGHLYQWISGAANKKDCLRLYISNGSLISIHTGTVASTNTHIRTERYIDVTDQWCLKEIE